MFDPIISNLLPVSLIYSVPDQKTGWPKPQASCSSLIGCSRSSVALFPRLYSFSPSICCDLFSGNFKKTNLLRPQHYICSSELPAPRIAVTFSLQEVEEIEKECAVYRGRLERIAQHSATSREKQVLRHFSLVLSYNIGYMLYFNHVCKNKSELFVSSAVNVNTR